MALHRTGKTTQTAGTGSAGRVLRAVLLGSSLLGASLASFSGLAPKAAVAQNMFAPIATVNDAVITSYELNQRIALMSVLGAGGADVGKVALDQLIDDRLRTQAALRAGITLGPDEVQTGMAEFAARGSLDTEGFLRLLASRGVAAETFRDFISAGVAWRNLSRARFISQAQVSETEIDRALGQSAVNTSLQASLSEIFLPARDDAERAQSEALAARIAANATIASFAAAAREYSVAPSRERSGRMDSVALNQLPPALAGQIAGLAPGEVTSVLATPNALGIFQLRALTEINGAPQAPSEIEYAAYYIDNSDPARAQKRIAQVTAQADSCDDLYGIAKGEPAQVLQIDSLPFGDIPDDVKLQLAQLDPGEASSALTRADGQTRVFLMLCGRSFATQSAVSRDDIRAQLQNQKLANLADSYLAQLKADAAITYK
ncbi:Chaperone SurA precursor [Aquimixticola soesokkakensis]|uniref:Parvulin-like PPIase n=1 Tax=Aquimixticola soesokkakensis TaxID=1519096 RepID=A0A1Y5TJC6_9RHOB|nr:peptidylprolyl isomerase [Aquimixticola soesokkakensis]SLN64948.1 Chaperone SurA precursor [Aquimixticola soesokkakensis]